MRLNASLTACVLSFALCATAQQAAQQAKDPGPVTGLLSEATPTFSVKQTDLPKKWTIIAYGDMRFTDPANVQSTNPKVRRWLVDKLAAEHPDAILLTGDVPWHGGVAADFAVYHTETKVWRDEQLRVYPALGNHELAPDATAGVTNWWNEFPELKQRRWYSVAMGSAYLLAIDSNLPLTAGSEQHAWLDQQLAALPSETKFVFLILHHPPVADNGPHERHNLRPNEMALADYLGQKQKNLKPRLIVISGHTHNYERFVRDGIVYLVSGGGGADPYPVERQPDDFYQAQTFPNYHYIRFSYDGSKLTATMNRVADPAAATPSWEIKDTFVIDPNH